MSFAGLALSAGSTAGNMFTSGITDVFAAQGDMLEAKDYGLASQYASQQAQFAKLSGLIQQNQLARQTTQVLGATQSSTASSNFSMAGSAADVLHSNAQQLSLNRATTALQSHITEQGYEEQAQTYADEEKTAEQSALMSQITSGLMTGGLSGFAMGKQAGAIGGGFATGGLGALAEEI